MRDLKAEEIVINLMKKFQHDPDVLFHTATLLLHNIGAEFEWNLQEFKDAQQAITNDYNLYLTEKQA